MNDERLIDVMMAGYDAETNYTGSAYRRPMRAAIHSLRLAGYAIVPTEGPEFEAMVERAAGAYWFELYGRHRHNLREWPEGVLGGSQDLFRAGCRAALRAALARPDEKGE